MPRLLPAPQAFLVRQEESRLPAAPGTVVGVFSGNVKQELNFFTNLLHSDDLRRYEVELVEVTEKQHFRHKEEPIFQLKQNAHLTALSIFSTCLSGIILGLSIWQQDGPALLAVVLLSLTSGLVGTASLCKVNNMPINMSRRSEHIPPGDLVIFYPKKAAFRIVRCNEAVARNYFRSEDLDPRVPSHLWRTIMLVATILLVGGLIMLGNSSSQMQAAFAAAYVLLNTLYWLSSTVDFTATLWSHDFDIRRVKVLDSTPVTGDSGPLTADDSGNEEGEKKLARTKTIDIAGEPRRPSTLDRLLTPMRSSKPRQSASQQARVGRELMQRATFTTALWTAIAVSGSARWVRNAQLAPTTAAWDQWLEEAERRSRPAYSSTKKRFVSACTEVPAGIILPSWDYKSRLEDLFKEEERRRGDKDDISLPSDEQQRAQLSIFAIVLLVRWGRRAQKSRRQWLAL